jgi:transcriptional regulator with XRE-family HTH domain
MSSIFTRLGKRLRQERNRAGMSQRDVASRVGRNAVRISELERDLLQDRWGRDRLTLLLEICDALGAEPILVPRGRAGAVEALLGRDPKTMPASDVPSAFDELFVDLGGDDDDEDRR